MKKLTVAQKREKAVNQLLERNTEMTLQDARKAMNAYYRLCGMDERLLYLENDERTCNKRSTKDLSDREQKAIERVKAYFKPFNATINYYGYLPTISDINKNNDLYLAHFYE